ncbi:MAG: prolyl oligopeptidase [Betaproteobacteria bacterium]|nr:MAG: prolyl oligopeptidase [Betaproteobacteria bacterium]
MEETMTMPAALDRLVLAAVTAGTVLLLAAPAASAQDVSGAIRYAAGIAKDLEYPSKPSGFGLFSGPEMALYRPEGPGPFPAVVLLHQCGGLRSENGKWQNMSVFGWAKEAVARGYVALVVDSLDSRGVDSVCMQSKGGVNYPRGVRDVLQAAAHLRKLPYVDKSRVALVGYSWGATVSTLASARAWAAALGDGQRFEAVVVFYPECGMARPAAGAPYEVLRADIDRPLLVLLGGKDVETPPDECKKRLAPLKAAGAPVEWHEYAGATHCWDCQNLDGFRKTDFRGTSVEYRFDEAATKDAGERMFSFFEKAFAGRK